MTHRALIVGGSVGGLFAANLLRTIGWEVLVVERTTGSLGDRGTGIGTRPELLGVMARAGIALDASIGIEMRGRIGLDRAGSIVQRLPMRGTTSAWSRIWRPLRQRLPDTLYRGGTVLTGLAQDERGLTATLADGSVLTADLLVAADGLHSTVRGQLFPGLAPGYAGYVAWRGVVDEHQVEPGLRDMLFHHMVLAFPGDELMLAIPMPGPDEGPHRGGRRLQYVWFRHVDEAALAGLCTDATGRSHGLSIPPPLLRPELIADLRAAADAALPPQMALLVNASRQHILQPIFDLETPALGVGRVALVGDAAFVARPHVATGVMKAAMDADALATALAEVGSGDLGRALARYDAERRRYGSWLVARGRHIAGYFAKLATPEARIATVMREYGAAGLVDNAPIAARIE